MKENVEKEGKAKAFNGLRHKLILKLKDEFAQDLTESLKPFNAEDRINVLGILIEILSQIEQKKDYNSIYKNLIYTISSNYKNKSTTLFNRNLIDHFNQYSNKLFDTIHHHQFKDAGEEYLSDSEYKEYVFYMNNLLHNDRHFTNLSLPYEAPSEQQPKVDEEAEPEIQKPNKEHTLKRRAIFLFYLNKHLHFSADLKPLAEVAHFLTGNNESNLYKTLLNSHKINGDGGRSAKAHRQDLIYVKRLFERLEMHDVIKTIDKDIASINS